MEMLKKANEAIVVVGEKEARSKSMGSAPMNTISKAGLKACQVLLPANADYQLEGSWISRFSLPSLRV
jgi:hypothetical protein